MTSHDVDAPLARLDAALARAEGRRDALTARAAGLTQEVELAKGRLALKSEIEALIEDVHNTTNRRNLAAFETLLSALVQEVLPGEKPVSLQLSPSAGSHPSTSAWFARTGRSKTCWRTMAARSPTWSGWPCASLPW